MNPKVFCRLLSRMMISFLLLLVVGCSKNDDNEMAYPDITLNKDELTLEKGKSERLIAAFTPVETPDKGHVWSSSTPGVATVDETGMITAVEPGETIITATALAGKKKATCKVTVVGKIIGVTGVSIKPTEAKIVVGDELTLEAIVAPETATNKSVMWTSGDGKLATVDGTGKVTAIAEGKVIIKATTKDGDKVASCQITVVNKGVEISKPEVSDVTSVSAIIKGKVEALGVKLGEVGICYSTAQSPTVADKKVALSAENLSHTLTKLDASTTYYVRIYATVDGVAKYGDQTMFTTEVAVDISEPQVSSITSNAAYVSGTIKTFGMQVEEVGICYSTTSTPTVDNTKVVLSENNIGYTLNELKPETTYYVRIFAKLNGKYYYGKQGEFSTTGIIKTHFEVTDVYVDKLELISTASAGITKVDICYGTSANPKITDNITTATKGVDGKLHLSLTNLKQGTVYYLRAYTRTGSKVEYIDDEVSAQTIGKDFVVTRRSSFKAEESDVEYSPIYRQWYRLYLTYDYNINIWGTYLVEAIGGGSLSKTGSYTDAIYLEKGAGTFTFMRNRALYEESWPDSRYYFSSETDIKFTNLDTKISYHVLVKSISFRSH